MSLKYVGDGFVAGIPARDLSDDEVVEYGGSTLLLKTGLYVEVKALRPTGRENKMRTPEVENKEVVDGSESIS